MSSQFVVDFPLIDGLSVTLTTTPTQLVAPVMSGMDILHRAQWGVILYVPTSVTTNVYYGGYNTPASHFLQVVEGVWNTVHVSDPSFIYAYVTSTMTPVTIQLQWY